MTALLALLQGLWPALRSYWSYGALAVVSLLAWHFDARAVANADAVRSQAAQFAQAQADATAAAQKALKDEQAAYAAKAQDADHAYQTQLAAAQSATDRYIALHRVQPSAVGSSTGATSAASQGSGAGVPATVPADSVMVSASDVRACTVITTDYLKARDWALGLNAP